MRKTSLVLLSIGALLALSIYWQGPASADGPLGAPPEGFGKKVAGVSLSWWAINEINGEPIEPVWGASTVTLSGDGTAMLSGIGDFNGMPEFPGFNTPVHAAWERIGQRQVRIKHLYFNFASGPEPPAGTLVAISRTTVDVEFNEDFTEYEGWGLGEVFAPWQMWVEGQVDPNTDEAPAYGTWGAPFGGTVLQVTP